MLGSHLALPGLANQLPSSLAKQVILYANHNSQANGFLQSLGKGTASSTHRGVRSARVPGLGRGRSFPRAGETLLGFAAWGARGERWGGGIYHHLLLDLSWQTSDLQLVREALRSLRNSFSGHDPQHHTIDSLEQGISSLMERLHRMEVQKRQEKRVRSHPLMWSGLFHPLRNPSFPFHTFSEAALTLGLGGTHTVSVLVLLSLFSCPGGGPKVCLKSTPMWRACHKRVPALGFRDRSAQPLGGSSDGPLRLFSPDLPPAGAVKAAQLLSPGRVSV